jgi:hypothetical protein
LLPRSDADGVKVPEAETPLPDQTPPAGENPVRVKAEASEQVVWLVPAFTAGREFTLITT